MVQVELGYQQLINLLILIPYHLFRVTVTVGLETLDISRVMVENKLIMHSVRIRVRIVVRVRFPYHTQQSRVGQYW
jgi:hypothetical protein